MTLRRTIPAILTAAVVSLSGCGSNDVGRDQASHPHPHVTARILVAKGDQLIRAVAAGAHGVWVGSAGGKSGTLTHIDPATNRVTSRTALPGLDDVAIRGRTVWAVGSRCVGPRPEDPRLCAVEPYAARVNPANGAVDDLIPLWSQTSGDQPQPGLNVATDRAGVWITLDFSPTRGEVLRLDPRTNRVVARISSRGFPGELAADGGSVWVLSHPQYTDETRRGTSLHEISSRSNEIVATPLRNEGLLLGGDVVPPLLAAGPGGVWVHSVAQAPEFIAEATRVDSHSGRLVRSRVRGDRFFPVRATRGGVWFIGKGPSLRHYNVHARQVDANSGKLKVTAVADAAFDPATGSFWIGDNAGAVLRVGLR
jgi:hypothetical protein